MNQTDANDVLAYLNRAGLLQAMAGQAAVWADALEDVTKTDALRVARDLARERTSRDRWVTPGDILAGVRTIRRERLDAASGQLMQLELPAGIDPDDVMGEHSYRRAVRELVASGQDVNDAARRVCDDLGMEPPQPVSDEPHAIGWAPGPRDQVAW